MTTPIIYVASAGTGKTTALMNHLEEALTTTSPETIVYTTFTNAGATEARDRAMERFPQYGENKFRFFRTLHSIANRAIERRPMMTTGDYIRFGKEIGMYINAKRASSSKDGTVGNDMSQGDKLLHLDALKRLTRKTWQEMALNQENSFFSADEIQRFSEAYSKFRSINLVYDFADQLEHFLKLLEDGEWGSKLTHLYVDEAQDLSPLQWAIIQYLSGIVEHVVIAGDDKQAIYAFSGADPKELIYKVGDRSILDKSYRLPSKILAFSDTVANRISEKQDFVCNSVEEGGHVAYVWGLDELDLSQGTWFFLVRNRKFLEVFEYALDKKGLAYISDSGNSSVDEELFEAINDWNDLIKGYSISAKAAKLIYSKYLRGTDTVKRGFKVGLLSLDDGDSVNIEELEANYGLVTKLPWDQVFSVPEHVKKVVRTLEAEGETKPRIRVATIHGVKGAEADNVVVLPDMAYMTNSNYNKAPDSEHRVFYVGVTRARKNLFLHQPITDMFYPL